MESLLILLLLISALAAGFAGVVWWRGRVSATAGGDLKAQMDALDEKLQSSQAHINQLLGAVGQTTEQMGQLSTQVNNSAHNIQQGTQKAINEFRESTERNLTTMSRGINQSITDLRTGNERSLSQINQTVNEQLQTTLERRLREQFQLVSTQLQNVHTGLGEMQALSAQVGNLQRVLTSARDRGQWGEVVLKDIIRQILTDNQYEENVSFGDENTRVEFAIKIPVDGGFALLPVDSKFPMEDYQRLLDAEQAGEDTAVHRKGLLRAFEKSAKDISEKYIRPPETTNFAFLFLPTDGLYAVAAGEPGFVDKIQQEQRVRITGPDNFSLFLSAVRMGFQLFAAGQRANEIRNTLAAVKIQFDKFEDVLKRVRRNLQHAVSNIDSTQTRVNVMRRTIGQAEGLPAEEVEQAELESPEDDDEQ